MTEFQNEQDLIKEQVANRNALNLGLWVLNATLLLVPIGMRPVDKDFSSLMLAGGTLGSTAAILYNSGKKRKLEQFEKIVDAAVNEDLAHQLAVKQKKAKTKNQIQGMMELAEIIEFAPEYMHPRLIEQYNMQGLIPSKVTLESEATLAGTAMIAPYNPPTMPQDGDDIIVDSSWMTSDFWSTSKCVVGAKGTGKTTFMAQEYYHSVRASVNDKPSTVYCVDVHHDAQDPKYRWFDGLDPDLEDALFVTKAKDGLKIFRRVFAEAHRRVDNKLKNEGLLKLIIDEYNGFITRLSEDERKEVTKMNEFIQFECRKFNVEVTLGVHNIKKGDGKTSGSGLDSTVVENMCLIALGNTIGDSNISFPADINRKQLMADIQIIRSQLPEKFPARPAVVRELGGSAEIRLLPKVDTSVFVFDTSSLNTIDVSVDEDKESSAGNPDTSEDESNDYYDQMLSWYVSLDGTPTTEELKAQWLRVSGRMITDVGAIALLEILQNM
jgi:hypothetical protein